MNTASHISRSATVQALVSCLMRHLQARRMAILTQVPAGGGPITAEPRPLSSELDQLDFSLNGTELDLVERELASLDAELRRFTGFDDAPADLVQRYAAACHRRTALQVQQERLL